MLRGETAFERISLMRWRKTDSLRDAPSWGTDWESMHWGFVEELSFRHVPGGVRFAQLGNDYLLQRMRRIVRVVQLANLALG